MMLNEYLHLIIWKESFKDEEFILQNEFWNHNMLHEGTH